MARVNPEEARQMRDWLERAKLDAAATQANEVTTTGKVDGDKDPKTEIPFISRTARTGFDKLIVLKNDVHSAAEQLIAALSAEESKPLDMLDTERVLSENYFLLQNLIHAMFPPNSKHMVDALEYCFYDHERHQLYSSFTSILPLQIGEQGRYCILGITERFIKLFVSKGTFPESRREINLTVAFSKFFGQKRSVSEIRDFLLSEIQKVVRE